MSRVVLEEKEYRYLKAKVFHRDRWKCRVCGKRQGLTHHHIIFRSHGGDDADYNLITVCSSCHDMAHAKGKTVLTFLPAIGESVVNANQEIRFKFSSRSTKVVQQAYTL